ncbi:MAG: ATP-sensitive inward rectifier potassium channel 10 [Sphaerospermopsis sp. SIO1G2]|nr:ATP-sensitive inward rectifier potassium channel 10 [Sphaerospermopsis sp. SIO1G2]
MTSDFQDFLEENQKEEALRRPQWEITGLDRKMFMDLYYYLIAAPWSTLLGLAFGGYLIINFFFAALYFFGLDGIANAQPDSFSDAFFFSVQTFSTIGFGAMSPQTPYTHLLVTIESFAGLVAVALGTGLIFAKFARPTAAVKFSKKMLIHNRDGVPHLHLRFANQRVSEIYNVRIGVSVLVDEYTSEGHNIRRNHRLPLQAEDVPLFTLNWTAMHKIDENSPLYGVTAETISKRVFFFIITLEGTEATLMQTVHASYFYRPNDVVFDHMYQDMVEFSGKTMVLNHEQLDKIEPIKE